jgi:hypothetical protein
MLSIAISLILVFQTQFYNSVDKNFDGKATFEEVKEYLSKYNPIVKDTEVTRFIRRRDINGISFQTLVTIYSEVYTIISIISQYKQERVTVG